jgi:Ras-related protein Rab-5C
MHFSSASEVTRIKMVMIGAASAGKTSLSNRFTYNRMPMNLESTVGASYLEKTVTIMDQDVRLEIWDTAGSERYRSLVPMYYRDANCAVVVFDITAPDGLDEAQMWIAQLRDHTKTEVIVALAANKIDRVVPEAINEQKINEFAAQCNIPIVKLTSALDGRNVNDLFLELAALWIVAELGRMDARRKLEPGPNKCC